MGAAITTQSVPVPVTVGPVPSRGTASAMTPAVRAWVATERASSNAPGVRGTETRHTRLMVPTWGGRAARSPTRSPLLSPRVNATSARTGVPPSLTSAAVTTWSASGLLVINPMAPAKPA